MEIDSGRVVEVIEHSHISNIVLADLSQLSLPEAMVEVDVAMGMFSASNIKNHMFLNNSLNACIQPILRIWIQPLSLDMCLCFSSRQSSAGPALPRPTTPTGFQ